MPESGEAVKPVGARRIAPLLGRVDMSARFKGWTGRRAYPRELSLQNGHRVFHQEGMDNSNFPAVAEA
jgi:hypothetical protein